MEPLSAAELNTRGPQQIVALAALPDGDAKRFDPSYPDFKDFDEFLRGCLHAAENGPQHDCLLESAQYNRLAQRGIDILALAKKLKSEVHTFNHPHLNLDAMFPEIFVELKEIAELIRDDDHRTPRERALERFGAHMVDVPWPEATMVATSEEVIATLAAVSKLAEGVVFNPNLFLDLEGLALGTSGTISLLQMYVRSLDHIFLVDSATLDLSAFTTAVKIGDNDVSLQSIFEDSEQKKVFFECRGDAEALFSLYNVRLQGVIDIQLLDLATRDTTKDRTTVKSMHMVATTRLSNTNIADATIARFDHAKYWGAMAIIQGWDVARAEIEKYGGDHKARDAIMKAEKKRQEHAAAFARGEDVTTAEIETLAHLSIADPGVLTPPEDSSHDQELPNFPDPFAIRPLPPMLVNYGKNDVFFLPILYEHYLNHRHMSVEGLRVVEIESAERLKYAQMPGGWHENGGVSGMNIAPLAIKNLQVGSRRAVKSG